MKFKSAVLKPPTCKYPVGDGAKRTRTDMIFSRFLGVKFNVNPYNKQGKRYDLKKSESFVLIGCDNAKNFGSFVFGSLIF